MKAVLILVGLFGFVQYGASLEIGSELAIREVVEEVDQVSAPLLYSSNKTDVGPLGILGCPCRNFGVCIFYFWKSYICLCPIGFVGRNCEYRACFLIPWIIPIQPFARVCLSPYRVCALRRGRPVCKCWDSETCLH